MKKKNVITLPSQIDALKSIRKPMPRPSRPIESKKSKVYKREKLWDSRNME